jgi:endonuclease YncB( thermonuclease family)
MRLPLLLSAPVIAVCASPQPSAADPVTSLDWSDGDSGRADGVAFRLADVDAPETGGVGSRGGAKCERERELGYAARAFIATMTKGKTVTIMFNGEVDDFSRRVATIAADGTDVGSAGIAAGHLRPYVFNGKRATMPKPQWCP